MITIKSNSHKKIQEQQQTTLNLAAGQPDSPITPTIRRLPYKHPRINNISDNVSAPHLSRTSGYNNAEDIYVKVNSAFKKIKTTDIYLVEGLCDYVNIYTKEKRYTIYSTMYGILEKLPKESFLRVHRSYIVSIDAISNIENNTLSVEMRRIPVGKTFKKEVFAKLNIKK